MTLMQNARSATPRKRLALAGLVLAALAAFVPLAGQASAAGPHLRITQASYGAVQRIQVEVNKSIIVDLPADVREVVVSQPSIANAIMRTRTRAFVQGSAGGDTNILFLDNNGGTIAVLDIKVYQPRSDVGNALEAAIARTIPGSNVRVESVLLDGATNRVVLSGSVQSQDDANRAMLMAVQFAGDEKNVANVMDVVGSQQVMLKVTIAEVDRNTVKQLGINLSGSLTVGPVSLGLESTPAMGGVSGVDNPNDITGSVAGNGFSLSASLKALEQRGAVQTLAEPTLTAISGQPATFLVGGQLPYQTRDADGNVTTVFKDFGVSLNFTPTVKSNGQIGLVVDTSVTEPVGGGAISERSAKTTVELPAGQTLSIAGIFQDSVRQQINQMPGLGDIPILGALFRSRDFIRSQTELVILVTPYLAHAGRMPELPTDNVGIASDAEAIFLGHMETIYGVGVKDGMRPGYDGSVGFVLD